MSYQGASDYIDELKAEMRKVIEERDTKDRMLMVARREVERLRGLVAEACVSIEVAAQCYAGQHARANFLLNEAGIDRTGRLAAAKGTP